MACGEFKQPPLRTPEFTEPGVTASDHLPNLGEREAVSDQRLRQRALGTLLEPQRLGVGAERLRNGTRAHEPALLLAEPFEAGSMTFSNSSQDGTGMSQPLPCSATCRSVCSLISGGWVSRKDTPSGTGPLSR